MLRDASHRHAIQKFSFIDSLNVSRFNRHPRTELGKPNTDLAFTFQQHKLARRNGLVAAKIQPQSQSAEIVPVAQSTATIDTNWYRATTDYSLSLAEIIQSTSERQIQSDVGSLSSKTSYLGKLLFALACSYGLFVVWWLFGAYGDRALVMISGGKQIVLPNSEVEFIDYMERSLANLERQAAAERREQEVVYVPVYTPTRNEPQELNTPSSTLSEVSSTDPTSGSIPPQPLTIPAPPPLPSPAPVEPSQMENEATPSSNSAAVNHTLIGILELGGDRSAALVKVRGKTRRVWVGEEIHADGWVLESVGNQQATIDFQGQIRSISVGETF